MTSLRIENATVVTQDASRRIVREPVRVDEGRITGFGPAARGDVDRVLDGTGQILMPGLINLHTHLAMTLLRGYGDDLPLEKWLETRIWPAEARIDSAAMQAGTDLGLLECITNGTTSFLDMYWMEEDVVAPACEASGVRGWVGEGLVDIGQTDKGQPNRKLAAIERFTKARIPKVRADPARELVTPCPAPHGAYTCNHETLVESARLAVEYGVPLHTHCSETRSEVHGHQQSHGRRPLESFEAAGALGPHTVLAHCGWITKAEVARIGAAKASVAHCPVSNMKLATGGVTPVPELHEAGVKVGLGTDGAASNNSLDLFETMKFAALVQKNHRWDATAIPEQKALDMATRDAADALLRPDLGRIEVGATADLILVDFRRPHLTPSFNPVSNLVYAARGTDVSATIVAGRVLMERGRVETIDSTRVMAQGQQQAERITKA